MALAGPQPPRPFRLPDLRSRSRFGNRLPGITTGWPTLWQICNRVPRPRNLRPYRCADSPTSIGLYPSGSTGHTPGMLDAFIHGALAGYGIAIPVGAIAVLIVGVGIRCGFLCGASAGAGAATADGLYASVAATAGAAAAAALEPWAVPIRWISGSALIALALWGLNRARRSVQSNEAQLTLRRGELARTYSRFLGLTVINPMTIVYFGTMVLGSGVGAAPGTSEVAMFVIGAFVASLSWQTLLAAIGAIAQHGLPARFQSLAAIGGNIIILALAMRIIFAPSS